MARISYLHSTVSSSVTASHRAIFPSAPACGRAFYSQRGFSLLELLLVLFILGLMATSAMLMTQGVEDQSKYDETKRRMEMIKRAIVGDSTRTINGGPEISGFVADIGRLPICLNELLYLGDEVLPSSNPKKYESPCGGTAQPISEWHKDDETDLWRGWRGPYLSVLPESDGNLVFRDGYGCNFQYALAGSEVNVVSEGADCSADESVDIAASGVNPLIIEDDVLTQNAIDIDFINQAPASAVSISSATATLKGAGDDPYELTINDGTKFNDHLRISAPVSSSVRMPIGVYLLEIDLSSCASCVGVTQEYQIILSPRQHVPAIRWIVKPK